MSPQETINSVDDEIAKIVLQAQEDVNNSFSMKVIGVFKYLYFISPIGYLLANREHTLVKEMTRRLV